MAAWDKEKMEQMLKRILQETVQDEDWDDARAKQWTLEGQQKVFEAFKRDGYKVVVLVEAVSKGSGCVKQQYSLISADDDCVVQGQITNSKGVIMYGLAIANKY